MKNLSYLSGILSAGLLTAFLFIHAAGLFTPDAAAAATTGYWTVTNFTPNLAYISATSCPVYKNIEIEGAVLDGCGNSYVASAASLQRWTNPRFQGPCLTNSDPFHSIRLRPTVSHLGGFAVYQGYLYAAVENYNYQTPARTTNLCIAIYNATNLDFISYTRITNAQDFAGLAVSPKGYVYASSYLDGNHLWVFSLSGTTNINYLKTVSVTHSFNRSQGLSYYRGWIYVASDDIPYAVTIYGFDENTFQQRLIAEIPKPNDFSTESPDCASGTFVQAFGSAISLFPMAWVNPVETSDTLSGSPTDPSFLVHWPLDDGQGWIVRNTSGNGANGAIGTTNHPNYMWTNSIFGGGLHLNRCDVSLYFSATNRQRANGNYYPNGGASGWNGVFHQATTNFTVSVWFLCDGTADNTAIMSEFRKFYYVLFPSKHAIWFAGQDAMDVRFSAINGVSPVNYSDGQPHLFTGTYDGTNLTAYVDGVMVGSTNHVTSHLYQSTTYPLEVCGYVGYGYSGTARDFRIYSRALSTSEIKSMYGLKNFGR